MKLLRETIRKILLENQQQYDKIVTMIMSLDPINVNSALMLAETMGYLEMIKYTADEQEEYKRGTFDEKETVIKHRWEFSPDDGMLDALEAAWSKGFKRNIFGVGFHQRPRNRGYVIRIVDRPSDRPSSRV
tara:strand:- start:2424 stop:2816 length:393 start_codon:yes stop_codon:yes gene_type:complete